jgi:hypothetical protein
MEIVDIGTAEDGAKGYNSAAWVPQPTTPRYRKPWRPPCPSSSTRTRRNVHANWPRLFPSFQSRRPEFEAT